MISHLACRCIVLSTKIVLLWVVKRWSKVTDTVSDLIGLFHPTKVWILRRCIDYISIKQKPHGTENGFGWSWWFWNKSWVIQPVLRPTSFWSPFICPFLTQTDKHQKADNPVGVNSVAYFPKHNYHIPHSTILPLQKPWVIVSVYRSKPRARS